MVCMPHVTALDLSTLLHSLLHSLKKDVVAVDPDSINVKGRKCNLLGWGVKCTLKYTHYHAQSQRKYTLKSMVERRAKAKRPIFITAIYVRKAKPSWNQVIDSSKQL